MSTQQELTILSVSITNPTEIHVELSNGTELRLTLEEILALQVKASGTAPTFVRDGEP